MTELKTPTPTEADLHKARRVKRLRLHHPELLKAGQVRSIATEYGMLGYAARKLVEGKDCALQRRQLPNMQTAFYDREELLTLLAGAAIVELSFKL